MRAWDPCVVGVTCVVGAGALGPRVSLVCPGCFYFVVAWGCVSSVALRGWGGGGLSSRSVFWVFCGGLGVWLRGLCGAYVKLSCVLCGDEPFHPPHCGCGDAARARHVELRGGWSGGPGMCGSCGVWPAALTLDVELQEMWVLFGLWT